MTSYSSYEKRAFEEIENWKNRPEGGFSKAFDRFIGRHFESAYNSLPENFKSVLEGAIKGFMEMLKDGSYWTFSKNRILNDARKLGLELNQVSDLREQDLEKLDQLARRRFAANKIASALEGAGTGMGGFSLLLADIPLLFGVAFRAIQEIGTCYGYEMDDPVMLPMVMHIFAAGANSSSVVKGLVLLDIRTTAVKIAAKRSYADIAKSSLTGAFIKFLKSRSEQLPSLVAKNITKRKLAQVLPGIGALVGAGFNYMFISEITLAAYMLFRSMYLSGKYGLEGDSIPEPEPGGSPSPSFSPDDVVKGYLNPESGLILAL